jgi:hypothetical protein
MEALERELDTFVRAEVHRLFHLRCHTRYVERAVQLPTAGEKPRTAPLFLVRNDGQLNSEAQAAIFGSSRSLVLAEKLGQTTQRNDRGSERRKRGSAGR